MRRIHVVPALLCVMTMLLAFVGCSSDSGSGSQPLTVTASIQVATVQEPLAVVEPMSEFSLTFSEPLNLQTVQGNVSLQVVKSGITVMPAYPDIEVTVDPQNPSWLLVRTKNGRKLESGEEYRLTVAKGVRSNSGNGLAEDYVRFFATDYDAEPPLLGIPLQRTKILVISDLHLGDKRSINGDPTFKITKPYGWTVANRDKLLSFLQYVRSQSDVSELVIAGDLFDEWVAPMQVDSLNGLGPSGFVDSIVEANRTVITAFNDIIQDGLIRVTYVPGNHDMLVTAGEIQRVFPGINQARDAQGLGVYSPASLPKLAIEHGHRYDFFNAPDPVSNRDITKTASILSPGFFVSKVAASSDLETGKTGYYRDILTDDPSVQKAGSYLSYLAAWELILLAKPVAESRADRVIMTGIDGYTAQYAINDLVPRGLPLDVLLYKNIEDSWWDQRQVANRVPEKIYAETAIAAGAVNRVMDLQSEKQYFLNSTSNKRIVVFGHTHVATLLNLANYKLQGTIYANSGTWVDKVSRNASSCTYVAIVPQKSNGATTDTVTVYQYNGDGKSTKLKSGAIRN